MLTLSIMSPPGGMRGDLFSRTIRIEVHRQVNRFYGGGHKGAIEIWNVQSYVTQPSLGGVLGVRELQGRLRGG